MRENRPYGSEGGESGSTGLPYPYRQDRWLVRLEFAKGAISFNPQPTARELK